MKVFPFFFGGGTLCRELAKAVERNPFYFPHTFMIYEKLIYSLQLDTCEPEKYSYNKVAVSFLKETMLRFTNDDQLK